MEMKTDDYWFRITQMMADECSNCKKRHVGCVIIDKNTGSVEGTGWNEHENDICDCIPGPSTAIYAETMALRDLEDSENLKEKHLVAYITHEPSETYRSALLKYVEEIKVRETSQDAIEEDHDEESYDIIKEIRQKLDKICRRTSSSEIHKYVSQIDSLLSQLIERGVKWNLKM